MKIGVDASSLIAQKTGIGSFASHLLEEYERDSRGVDFVRLAPGHAGDLNTPRRLWWEAVGLPAKARAARIDALYSPGFSPPPALEVKRIVTVHDLIGLLFPANMGPVPRFYWKLWLPANLKRADRLVASSQCTQRDIVRLLGLPAERICVVPLAARETFRVLQEPDLVAQTVRAFGIRQPYFISVSSLEPRKNHLRLLKAFGRFQKIHSDFSLVIAGKPAGAEALLRRFIKEEGLESCVKLLDYVPEEALVSLYNGAWAYVMISLYEGFGLPALEAMRCGLTGVVAGNSSLPEVTGDTAWKVAPEDEGAIEEALRALARDTAAKREKEEAALKRSAQFSIARTASLMAQIFREEIGS